MLGAVSFEAHMPTALAELHLGSHSFLLQDHYVSFAGISAMCHSTPAGSNT
jgi:hypothetical protein